MQVGFLSVVKRCFFGWSETYFWVVGNVFLGGRTVNVLGGGTLFLGRSKGLVFFRCQNKIFWVVEQVILWDLKRFFFGW